VQAHIAALLVRHDQSSDTEAGENHNRDPQPGVAVVTGLWRRTATGTGAARLNDQAGRCLAVVKVDRDGFGAGGQLLQRRGIQRDDRAARNGEKSVPFTRAVPSIWTLVKWLKNSVSLGLRLTTMVTPLLLPLVHVLLPPLTIV
jgi:hypothetical protein